MKAARKGRKDKTTPKNKPARRATRPQAASYSHIPAKMRAAKRWLLWKKNKQPFYASGAPRSGTLDSERDTARLVAFSEAVSALQAAPGVYAGIGFALGDGWQGCDLDGIRDPDTGAIVGWARALIERSESYAEVSPSGRGVHIIGYGPALATLGANNTNVEVYCAKRYFTVTGARLNGIGTCADLKTIYLALVTRHGENEEREAAPPKGNGCAGPPVHRPLKNLEWPGLKVEAEQLLADIHPDVPYDVWCDIGMALNDASGGAASGLKLYDEWSAKGSTKYKEGEPAKKWQSFTPGGGIRFGSLRYLARRWKGWKPGDPTPPDPDAQQAESDEDDFTDAAVEVLARFPFPEAALYGPLVPIVSAATRKSEATRPGVALSFLAHVVAACFRPFHISLGDDRAGLNLYGGLVGPSGKGRKGTSAAYVGERLMPALHVACKQAWETNQSAAAGSRLAEGLHAQKVRECEAMRQWRDALDTLDVSAELGALAGQAPVIEAKLATARANIVKLQDHADSLVGATPRRQENAAQALACAKSQIEEMEGEVAALESRRALLERFRASPQAEKDRARKALDEMLTALPAAPVAPILNPMGALHVPPHTLTGVSSGEGIIRRIADQADYDDGSSIAGTPDKRLLLDVHEGGGLFAQFTRPDNTLSMKLRDGYDGKRLETNAKTHPVVATDPHLNMMLHITMKEFQQRLFNDPRSSESENGMANRPLWMFVNREKLVALPEPVPDAEVKAHVKILYRNLERVYRHFKITDPVIEHRRHEVRLSAEARALWDAEYEKLTRVEAATAQATNLLARLDLHTRKLAAMLALLNGETEVSAPALRAALNWAEYMARTADRIVGLLAERAQFNARKTTATKVLDWLKKNGGVQTFKELIRAFRGSKAAELTAALQYLAEASPPLIEIQSSRPPHGGRPRQTIHILQPG